MPGSSKACDPRGHEIEFFEDTHVYQSIIDGKEIRYISGTTFLSKYYPKFDPTGEITRKCAAREGITVEEIKARWKAKSDSACVYGTRVHELCEDIELGREIRNTPQNETEQKAFANATKIATAFRQKMDILGVEKIIFSPELQLAGTIDLFGRSRKDGTYLIIDHKTNQKIETENKYNKFCNSPIEHVPDLSFHHYSLQLNLYAYLLRYGKYVLPNAKFKFYLNHITEEKFELIELPDMQNEIKDLMIDYLQRKINGNWN